MLILILTFQALAYEVVVQRQQQYCFGEDITINTLVVGEVKIRDQRPINVFSLKVFDRDGHVVHEKDNIREDKFSFVSVKDGQHLVCLNNPASMPIVILFEFNTGLAAKDYSDLPQAKDMKESERRVKRIVDAVKEIQKLVTAIKQRDVELTLTNETVGYRIVSYSIVTLLLLLFLALAQTMYLKNYLKSKKMI